MFDLSYTNLSRFDLYYFRKSTTQDDPSESFMENYCEKVHFKSKRKRNKNYNWHSFLFQSSI